MVFYFRGTTQEVYFSPSAQKLLDIDFKNPYQKSEDFDPKYGMATQAGISEEVTDLLEGLMGE